MIHIVKTSTLILAIGAGITCRCYPLQGDEGTQVSTARSFLAAAAIELEKIADDRDREYMLYDLAGMQAMVGDIERAKATASACSAKGQRSETYMYVGALQGALGDKKGARQTLLLARKAALAARSPDKKERSWLDLGLLAIEHARIGDFQGASETLQLIEDAKSREEYQTSIAHFQPEEDAKKTVNNIKDPFRKDLGVKDIVESQSRSGNRAAAWASAKEIGNLSLRTSAYITIAETVGNADDTRRAYAQAKASVEEIRRIEDKSEVSGIPGAGDREFHEIVTSQARMGDIEGAKVTVGLVQDPTEKAASFIDIACAQLQASDQQGARDTLANAVKVRTIATSECDFMQQLAEALAQAGNLPEAMKTISLMDERGESRDHAYEQIIDILLNGHQIGQAKQIVARISDPRWKATALARIGAAESATGDALGARKTFAESLAITATVSAKSVESWTWDRYSVYHYVAMRQAETGDFEEIKRWIPRVTEPRDRVGSWLGAASPSAHQFYENREKEIAGKTKQGASTGAGAP